MNPWTLSVIGGTVIVWIAWDVFAALRWGHDATISQIILRISRKYPVVPFAAGFLAGHLFAQLAPW